ncbi:KilA-N domain-containing protein [Flavitalea sp. BT771]|uniref:KilA-N domain-containing protein n=1 Tax=Flavitalea sp. BT771 TaxID=3063329 RepID=UPI0026E341B9|nr:KilA-N domain-containing protein [Flavitalea sp. BT771]MDO6434395.1 KilA-N domain-containing protein [Flavitalea sp. BT771]MDV6223295.1 KilA-N domain-containing protein [Flavitalea sp. BT771]
MPEKKQTIEVKGTPITIMQVNQQDYISLTNIARHKNPNEPKDIVKNWMRSKTTIEFLGLWEKLHNPKFKGVEFDSFVREAGSNAFVLSPTKWIENTHAIGIISKPGNTGGTYAHKDIAFEFAAWLSAEFKLYLIMEFQRLKDEENSVKKQEWTLQRTLSKINYRIHTDAIKETLIPPVITKEQSTTVYASEADLLNVALFGQTARQWRDQNQGKQGNIRDEASLEQLVVLTNLESINALLIRKGYSQTERLQQLNEVAIQQMKSLLANTAVKKLSR